MFSKILKNWTLPLIICASLILGTAGDLRAFSVDVKNIYYYDQLDAMSPSRIVDYNFSEGTNPSNMIVIPDSFVTKKQADTGLSYVFMPYPDPTNDITIALDATNQKATFTGTKGGAVLYTSSGNTPALPNPQSATPGWTWAVKLTNFSGITDPNKGYQTQIGIFTPTGNDRHPEFTAIWRTGGVLEIGAAYYDNTGMGSYVWQSTPVSFTGSGACASTA